MHAVRTSADDSRWEENGPFNVSFIAPAAAFPGVDTYYVELEASDHADVLSAWGWQITTVERWIDVPPDALLDEDGNPLLDEDGNVLLEETAS